MASATVIARSDRRSRLGRAVLSLTGSRVGRTIIALNLLGLLILVAGALVFNELRRNLIDAQIDSLKTNGQFLADLLSVTATVGEPEPLLYADIVRDQLLELFPRDADRRARVFSAQGRLIADSYFVSDTVDSRPLEPLHRAGGVFRLDPKVRDADESPKVTAWARRALTEEVEAALKGEPQAHTRVGEGGHRVTSVSIPIRHVRAVTGVLTLEQGDVDEIIFAQRLALIPFVLMALLTTLASSLMMNRLIAEPVRRLAKAADQVTEAQARAISLPDVSSRNDELGDLSRALETMTATLSERMDAIDRFAADVAHEIRNPLTSIRSAVETLELVGHDSARKRLTQILNQDVGRLDRLVTDISNASRLDAELSREPLRPVDLSRLLGELADLYSASAKPEEPPVRFQAGDAAIVAAREGPLSQVFRNLIDNARSFSPPSGEVRIELAREGGEALVRVEDEGPGIPPENLETVFERFYTSRPKGTAFGGNSGLGLSIARQIVTAHGGRVWAENRGDGEGRIVGARFIVALPERAA